MINQDSSVITRIKGRIMKQRNIQDILRPLVNRSYEQSVRQLYAMKHLSQLKHECECQRMERKETNSELEGQS